MVSWIDRRKGIIERIIVTIKKIEDIGIELAQDKLITEICAEYGCSQKTALEYIESARFKIQRMKEVNDSL